MDQRFLDEVISRRPELFKAMANFNLAQQKEPALCPALSSLGVMGHALQSDSVILRELEKQSPSHTISEGWWDFSEESCRLLLLDDSTVTRVALFFSSAVYAEELARVIDRKQVLELRDLLGEEIFHYALRRGRYQIGSLRNFLVQHTPEGTLAERIKALAGIILLRMADGWPAPLRTMWEARLQRSALFSPVCSATEDSLFPLPQEQRRALWFTLKKLLLREAAPQWAPCFD